VTAITLLVAANDQCSTLSPFFQRSTIYGVLKMDSTVVHIVHSFSPTFPASYLSLVPSRLCAESMRYTIEGTVHVYTSTITGPGFQNGGEFQNVYAGLSVHEFYGYYVIVRHIYSLPCCVNYLGSSNHVYLFLHVDLWRPFCPIWDKTTLLTHCFKSGPQKKLCGHSVHT
jgi:hypothetical protein